MSFRDKMRFQIGINFTVSHFIKVDNRWDLSFSSLTLNNVDQSESGIWHYFPDDSKVTAKNSNFKGTLDNNAQANIDGSKDYVQMTVKNSEVEGDIVAEDKGNGKNN